MNQEWQKEIQSKVIKQKFEDDCKNIGVIFEGSFFDTDMINVINPSFQYDIESRNLLLEAKDDSRIPYWRSVSNNSILLDNAKKNELYELLKFT